MVLIRRIFALQERGDIPAALRETDKLGDPILLGAILADRYLRRPADVSASDLTSWLTRFGDQADAPAMRRLAMARLPAGTALPAPPAEPALPDAEGADAADPTLPRNPMLDRAVREQARAGKFDAALRLIERTRGLSGRYSGQLRGEVAQGMLLRNRDAEALATAMAGVAASKGDAALAAHVAGLAAWRLGRVSVARTMFETAARSTTASPSLRASAAFWTARTSLRLHDSDGSLPWMRRAAAEPTTFYGLLARRALGMSLGSPSSPDVLASADVEAIAATPHGLRAFALLQLGQTERAEAELRALWPAARQSEHLGQALALVARQAGFTDLAAEMSGLLPARDELTPDNLAPADARMSIPRLMPRGGFRLDPALIYALARVESNFDNTVISRSGAIGLMQIMPVTAGTMAGDPALAGAYRRWLHDPAVNLDIGQRYVSYLAKQDMVDGSLIHLLASYNAGPLKLQQWSSVIKDGGDPLMFIECIPATQTRVFVQLALTYTWLYAAKLNLAAPTIDELAAGAWPRFHANAAPGHTVH